MNIHPVSQSDPAIAASPLTDVARQQATQQQHARLQPALDLARTRIALVSCVALLG